MKISIIIPTYNSAKTLSCALNSIISQSYSNWEVLVVDGVSKDDTISIAKSYDDNRICIISEPDTGIYDAMNKGIERSNGEWLYFLGSDDMLYDHRVLQFFFYDNNYSSFDIVYGDVIAPQLSEQYKGEWSINNIDYNRCHQAIFYKRSVFNKLGKYNLKYKILADYDFNIKWMLNKKIKVKYVDRVVANYATGGVSATDNDCAFWEDYEWNILKRGFSMLPCKLRIDFLQKASNSAKMQRKHLRYIVIRFFKYVYKLLN